MKILFIESNYKGHHISLYAKKLMQKFLEENNVYFLTSIKSFHSEEFKSIKKLKKKIKIITIDTDNDIIIKNNISIFLYHLRSLFLVYKSAIKIIKKERIDLVYFNHFDPYIFILAIFFFFNFNTKVFGLLLNIKFHQYYFNLRKKNYLDGIKFYLFKIFLNRKYIKKIFIIDELFFKFLNLKGIKSNKIVKINEAFYKKKKINIIKKEKSNQKKILIYGSISIRKNFKVLIDFLINTGLIYKFKVVIAGKFDEECKRIIISEKYLKIIKEKRLIIKDYFINLKDEQNLFAKTDLVWLCYEGGSEGSSGVLEIAIDNIKPVIFYNKGLINYICQKNKLGFKILYNQNQLKQLGNLLFSKNLDRKIHEIKKNIKKILIKI
jgi:hypothetical protein